MRMNQNERRFDFHGLGLALKRAREEKGWTQAYVAELVDRDSRTIMNIENKGQYPSFDLFVKLITMFDISVDQFIHADGGAQTSSCRKHIDVLLNSMNEKELVVIEATELSFARVPSCTALSQNCGTVQKFFSRDLSNNIETPATSKADRSSIR